MSDEKETKPEGASEQITIRVRDQVSVLSCPVLSYFTVLNNWQSTAFIKIKSVEVTRAWAFDTSIPINRTIAHHTITHSHTFGIYNTFDITTAVRHVERVTCMIHNTPKTRTHTQKGGRGNSLQN